MEPVYRGLKIRRPLAIFTEEERTALITTFKKVKALTKLMRYKEIAKAVAEVDGLKYFYEKMQFFKLYRHAIFTTQVRVNNERDQSRRIFIDLSKGELRLRQIIPRRAIVIKLNKNEIKYIKQRLEENGKLVFAEAWIEDNNLYIALTFKRDVTLITPKKLIVVDINALHHGLTVGVIGDNGIETLKEFKAPVEKIYFALEQARVWALAWSLLRYSGAKKKRKKYTQRAYNLIKDFVNRVAHEIVELARQNQAEIWVDAPFYKSVKELYERKMPRGKKILLAGIRRVAKRIEEQAAWYGIPTRRITLPSSRCPKCDAKMREVEGRTMVCDACGFTAPRDHIPLYWGLRKWREKRAQPAPVFSSSLLLAPN
ncbi:MAG: zinc ribbon domain-containing protein [Thermoproteus sp.]